MTLVESKIADAAAMATDTTVEHKVLGTAAALRLVRAYSRIREHKLQQAIMRLVESIAADDD